MFRTAIFALSKLQHWEGGGRERENLEKKKKKGGEILQVEQIVAGIFLFQLNFFVIDILKIFVKFCQKQELIYIFCYLRSFKKNIYNVFL